MVIAPMFVVAILAMGVRYQSITVNSVVGWFVQM